MAMLEDAVNPKAALEGKSDYIDGNTEDNGIDGAGHSLSIEGRPLMDNMLDDDPMMYDDEDGERYRPPFKRTREMGPLFGNRERELRRRYMEYEFMQSRNSRSSIRSGSLSRFRTRGFPLRGPGMYRSGPPGFGGLGAMRSSRFRGGPPGWEGEWNEREIPGGSVGHHRMSRADMSGPNMGLGPLGMNAGPLGDGSRASYGGSYGNGAPNGADGRGMMGESEGDMPADSSNVWLEAKSADGKSYFYNAQTRETTWDKPEGPNVKVYLQEQMEAMMMGCQQAVQMDCKENEGSNNMNGMTLANTMQPPPSLMAQNPYGQTYGAQGQFGMPPPGYAASYSSGSNWPMNQMAANNTPAMMNVMQPQQIQMHLPPVITPEHENKVTSLVDAEIIAKASDWSEHTSPDGRSYFYNAKLGQSVWEKPQAMIDLEVARMAAYQEVVKKESDEKATEGTHVDGTTMADNNAASKLSDEIDINEKNQADKLQISQDITADSKFNYNDSVTCATTAADTALESNIIQENDKDKLKEGDDEEKCEATGSLSRGQSEDKKQQEEEPEEDRSNRAVDTKEIEGSHWAVVWTGDGRVFFYSKTLRQSVWTRPPELADRTDVDAIVAAIPPGVLAERDRIAKLKGNDESKENRKEKCDTGATNNVDKSISNYNDYPVQNTLSTVVTTVAAEIITNTSASNYGVPVTNVAYNAAQAPFNMISNATAYNPAAYNPSTMYNTQAYSNLYPVDASGYNASGDVSYNMGMMNMSMNMTSSTITASNNVSMEGEPSISLKSLGESVDEPMDTTCMTPEESNSTNVTSILTDKRQIESGKESAMEAEARAAKERANVPLEMRINSFREMLAEREVSAFSTWEKELSKIVFDSRYLLLTSKERKQVFEKYVKERAEEERQEKRNKLKQKKEEFRNLLQEAHLHGKSLFTDFCSRHNKDERYKNIDKMRERESLFNEFILNVRKKEKELSKTRREQAKKGFMELLKERTDIDRHTKWADIKKKIDSDSRYKAVDSSVTREDYFRDYIRILKEEKRKEKENKKESKDKDKKEKKDKDKDKEKHRDKDKDKDKNRDEPDEDKKTISDGEEKKEAEKAARVEASLREREKEVQRTLAVHLRDRDAERENHKHDEAVVHFNALLADLVRNSELTWREAKRQLRKDKRWELADLLERDEKEKLFNAHTEVLTKKKKQKFRELLDETNGVNLSSSWKEVKKLIKDDPRYTKFSSSDRKCEREYKEYVKDKVVTAKSEFRELLQETKCLTHKSMKMSKENDSYIKEIEEILQKDKRYDMLEWMPDERTHLIINYMDELEKKGPPPPPTASEPTRRSLK